MLVEFALVIPILMMFLFGIVQFGIAYDRQQTVTASARAGARLGSVPDVTKTQITDRARATMATATFQSVPVDHRRTQRRPPCKGRVGELVTVRLAVGHTIDIPFVGRRDVTLTAASVFQCE